jgi:hypothetical protein
VALDISNRLTALGIPHDLDTLSAEELVRRLDTLSADLGAEELVRRLDSLSTALAFATEATGITAAQAASALRAAANILQPTREEDKP